MPLGEAAEPAADMPSDVPADEVNETTFSPEVAQ
jgi:hypothetical protein